MISLSDANIKAVLVGGDWVNVSGVVIDYAEYTATHTGTPATITAHGLHLYALIRGGPNNGAALVAPLAEIQAVRT